MQYEVEIAKNGEETLKINGRYIYSKYSPRKEVQKWVDHEVDESAGGYILIGLGLGYHLQALMDKAPNKPIQVLSIFENESFESELPDFVEVIYEIMNLKTIEQHQILIPHVWVQAMGENHPLYKYIADLKMKQVSFQRFKSRMKTNFYQNIKHKHYYLQQHKKEWQKEKTACLIASGPSLDETVHWLKEIQEKVFILCVGSALKTLLQENIQPDAVIISDCQENITRQFDGIKYNGLLYYLSTANSVAVSQHKGEKCILLQEGYSLAEEVSIQLNYPLLQTGGSVATTAYSLLAYLNFEKIILFGQDLAVTEKSTHSRASSSNRAIIKNESLIEVSANNGRDTFTLHNLYSYKLWYEKVIPISKIPTYTTSFDGASITGVDYLSKELIYAMLK